MFDKFISPERLSRPLIKWTVVLALFTIIFAVTCFLLPLYQKMYIHPTYTEPVVTESVNKTSPTEAEIRAQLDALSEQSKGLPKLSEVEIEKQLNELSEVATGTPTPSEAEIRAQLDTLSGLNAN